MMNIAFVWHAFLTFSCVADFAIAVILRYNSSAASEPLHVYIHVPKCAGTSFSDAMRPASTFSNWWPKDIRASGCSQRWGSTNVKDLALSLHCGLSELESCIQNGKACYWDPPTKTRAGRDCPDPIPASVPLRFIMMIRDPVQRVLSEYYFVKMLLGTGLSRSLEESNLDSVTKLMAKRIWSPSVREVAMSGGPMDWVQARGNPAHNAMTKMLINGEAGFQSPVLRHAPGHVSSCAVFDHEDYVSHWENYYGSNLGSDVEATINSDQQLLSAAVSIIEERFYFVGLVEHFDESVSRLTSLLGLTSPHASGGLSTDKHASGKPEENEVAPDLIGEVRARNKLDIGVYHAVLASKFWAGSSAESTLLEMQSATATRNLTWQSVVAGDREGAVFEPSIIFPTREQQ